MELRIELSTIAQNTCRLPKTLLRAINLSQITPEISTLKERIESSNLVADRPPSTQNAGQAFSSTEYTTRYKRLSHGASRMSRLARHMVGVAAFTLFLSTAHSVFAVSPNPLQNAYWRFEEGPVGTRSIWR